MPAAELYAEVSSEKDTTPSEGQDDAEKTRRDDGGVEFDIVADDGSLLMRNNKLTIDDTSRQALSMGRDRGTEKGKRIERRVWQRNHREDHARAFGTG